MSGWFCRHKLPSSRTPTLLPSLIHPDLRLGDAMVQMSKQPNWSYDGLTTPARAKKVIILTDNKLK